MAAKREQNSVLLATIEVTEGVAIAANPSTDVVLVENLNIKFNETQQSTSEVTGTLDTAPDIPIGGPAEVTFDTWMKASGTAGAAPEIGKLLKACGWGETVTAAAIGVPTAATAGTGNTITLPAAPFAGAAGAYVGMPVQLTGNPAGPLFSLITGWSGSQVMSLAETFTPILSTSTLAQIPKNVLYSPISIGIPSLTLSLYKDGIQHTVAGCRGDWRLAMEAGKGITVSWTFSGILQMPRADNANPTSASPDAAQAKLVWRNDSNNGVFAYAGSRIGVQQLNFNNGTKTDHAPNPNQPSGFDVADIGSRMMAGDFNPRLTSIATRDILAQKRAGTVFTLEAIARRGAGNSFGLLIPAAQATAYDYERQGPMIGEKVPFKATGANSGAYLCFF